MILKTNVLTFAFPEYFADIDECSTNSHSCDVNAACSNVQGSYTCTCQVGYSGDGKTCTGKGLQKHFFFITIKTYYKNCRRTTCHSENVMSTVQSTAVFFMPSINLHT